MLRETLGEYLTFDMQLSQTNGVVIVELPMDQSDDFARIA